MLTLRKAFCCHPAAFGIAAAVVFYLIILPAPGILAQENLDAILAAVEKRYSGPGFAADFFQHSTLKAMDISDSAQGRIWVKRPAKMRWEYYKPEKQTVISNGRRLWIYRPLDKQVMVGEAPDMFGQGKGAAFLSDMNQLRKNFEIALAHSQNPAYWRIKLVPLNPKSEIVKIFISISRKNYCAEQIVTYNAYGDETRIVISNYDFQASLPEALFEFDPPENVELIEIKQ